MKHLNILFFLFLFSCSLKKHVANKQHSTLDSNTSNRIENIEHIQSGFITNYQDPLYYFLGILFSVLIINIIIYFLKKI